MFNSINFQRLVSYQVHTNHLADLLKIASNAINQI